ncbi:hypothetical protein [Microbacterium luteolum]|uniref:hypothetical protein n=1 Tax=Microbacterium luteolum TaxID=69367 RepID=UPI0031DF4102
MVKSVRDITSADRELAMGPAGASDDQLPVAAAEPRTTRASMGSGGRPASSLVRWERHEVLRDAVIDFAKRRNYSVQTILIESIRRGLAQLDSERWVSDAQQNRRSASANGDSRERTGRDIVIELRARAYRENDETWTIEIPRLVSRTPSGAIIVATGSALDARGIAAAAVELASAWLGVDATEIAVRVSVDEPRGAD